MRRKPAVRALQVRGTATQRVIRLVGDIEATVEFTESLGTEAVRVNGKVVSTSWGGLLRPVGSQAGHYFVLPSAGEGLRSWLGVTYSQMGAAWKLVLRVGGVVVYADEDYGKVVTVGTVSANLPIPASGPAPQPGDLPVPAADPGAADTE